MEPESKDRVDPATSLTAYLQSLQAALQPPTKYAATLPDPADASFHRSIDRQLSTRLDKEAARVQHILERLNTAALPSIKTDDGAKQQGGSGRGEEVEDTDSSGANLTSTYSRTTDVIDTLLESADVALDQYQRTKSSATASETASGLASSTALGQPGPSRSTSGKLPPHLLNAQIEPPQRHFTIKPDNSVGREWDRPLSLGKPNAQVPLGWQPPLPPNATAHHGGPITRPGMWCAEGDPRRNPYFWEVTNSQPPPFVFQPPGEVELVPPPGLRADDASGTAGVPFQWISTASEVEALSLHLQEERVREIAIDLEAHSYRSYQGIACLVQLSTRWGDFILDILADPVRQAAEKLNIAFTDPSKVKILHGAEHDVLWMQRDLGLYVVNLFDTYHATNVLGFPAHGLAYLLSRYYDFEADKRYQLADWRIRPLPQEMLYYARSDTHALIYVYHRLRDELLKGGGKPAMDEVFARSRVTAARRYAIEEWDEEGDSREGWRSLWRRLGGSEAAGTDLRRTLPSLGKTERLVRRLHRWRDEVARIEDESPKYILSAMNLVNLASRAPTTKADALAVLTPSIQPVRRRAGEIAKLIKQEILEWEEVQHQDRQRRQEELEQHIGAAEEDFGSVESSPVTEKQRALASSSTSSPSMWTTTTQSSHSGVGDRLRSVSSSLFGTNAPESHSGKPVTTGSSSVNTLIGQSLRSLFGGRSAKEAQPAKAAPLGADIFPVAEKQPLPLPSASNASDCDQHTTAPGEALDTGEETEATAADGDGSPGIVDVKRKKKWTKAKKRRAREERHANSLGSPSAVSPPSSKKRRKGDASDVAIQPFDYSNASSILESRPSNDIRAPMRKSRQSAQTGDRSKSSMVDDPTRFADMKQPSDRANLGHSVGKSHTFDR